MTNQSNPTLRDMPTSAQIEAELARERYNRRYRSVLRSTLYGLLAVAAAAVLIATLLTPVLKIYGSSMTPTLEEGSIVVALKGSHFEQGDIVAFYYNNKILVKRVIAGPGEWVTVDGEGNVYVNNVKLNEPYLTEKSLGDRNITYPYQVPADRWFVMGDHRSTSVDSRNTAVGCVADETIVGRIVWNVWPLDHVGPVK